MKIQFVYLHTVNSHIQSTPTSLASVYNTQPQNSLNLALKNADSMLVFMIKKAT